MAHPRLHPIVISTGSAVFAGLPDVTNKHRHTERTH